MLNEYLQFAKAGYPKNFALGALCAAGTLGIVVPPSIPLILYGIMTQTSIGDLFIAGIGPAILLTSLMLTYAVAQNFSHRESSWDFVYIAKSLRKGIWALLMPLIILGGIYTGYFTATESAAVAVVYAFIVESLIHKEMNWDDLRDVIRETTKLLGSLFPVLMIALSLNVFLTYEEVPQNLVAWMPNRHWFCNSYSRTYADANRSITRNRSNAFRDHYGYESRNWLSHPTTWTKFNRCNGCF